MERRPAAVLIADVVGYSRLSQINEEETRRRFGADLKEIFEPQIEANQGRLIKTMGDGILAEFGSVVRALASALAIQEAEAERNAGLAPDRRLEFRIGINLGDVIVEDDDIHGTGVNIAARLQVLAPPGGIVLSGTAYDHVAQTPGVHFQNLGTKVLKNIADPVRAYAAVRDAGAENVAARSPVLGSIAVRRGWAVPAGILVLVLCAVGYWWAGSSPQTAEPGGNVAVAATSAEPSLVVLPFDNIGDDKDQAYLADGMTEDLTTELARIPGLFVASRNAAFTYKGQPTRPAEIARDLGVIYILEGSVRRVGDDMRINAQLIDARSGGHLWAERFDGSWAEVFSLQDDVLANVSSALKLRLVPTAQAMEQAGGTDDSAAYDLYLQGQDRARGEQPKDFADAAALFRRALAVDPDFGRAAAELAFVYWNAWNVPEREMALRLSNEEMLPEIYRLLADAERHPSAAFYQLTAELLTQARDSEGAIRAAESAIAIDPSDPYTYHALSMALSFAGRPVDAERFLVAASRLEPAPSDWRRYLFGLAYFGQGRLDDARAILLDIDDETGEYWSRLLRLPLLIAATAELGQAGETDRYKQMMQATLSSKSEATPSLLLAQGFYPYRQSADRERVMAGLRKAGVPELPFDIDDRLGDRLTGAEIRELLFGHTIRGVTSDGQIYERETGHDGQALVRIGSHAEEVVTTAIDGDAVCVWSYIWGDMCGAVLRNPDGAPETFDEYELVFPYSRRAFSVVEEASGDTLTAAPG
ncbi:adenylate/guanylate cyclase domain-containing protein [Aurantimonas endophytica]|uniref:TolB-like protein/class 3 adenylate cyclase/Tfp pilus assembly protein PilF n=1 Tax=Aurantimonas endophytica TaxID=1522175 RepID=A0A7W6MQ10_9HYPH|nr:adenylate/guanylate cyclase domain-containing protein [Aurantimonas endophytica]MBB4003452.1 TolB-like protein/class 3 adenylate cyclase/Tfp pilus assembly protein PilF [Aurantimonas endophytica]MCO6404313.1 guanylate cyclase [Aurantimonas endophytica]